jgi:lycopene cyclase domain-containing protein
MSYLQFHAVFTLPVLVVLRVIQPRFELTDRRIAHRSILLIAVIAFAYTTPWDIYLVDNGVWYYGPERVLGTWANVPFEEYAFFLIQTFITGLWTSWLLHRPVNWIGSKSSAAPRIAGTAFFLAATATGCWLSTSHSSNYLALILIWATPILALQWAVGGNHLWRLRQLILLAFALPSAYLCIADAYAISNGIWIISEASSTGILIGVLPLEEAIFFLVTNLLVVQGVLLSAHLLGHSRLEPLSSHVS